jgi:hypothetical protein
MTPQSHQPLGRFSLIVNSMANALPSEIADAKGYWLVVVTPSVTRTVRPAAIGLPEDDPTITVLTYVPVPLTCIPTCWFSCQPLLKGLTILGLLTVVVLVAVVVLADAVAAGVTTNKMSATAPGSPLVCGGRV